MTLVRQVRMHLQQHPGTKARAIATALSLPAEEVYRALARMEARGIADMRGVHNRRTGQRGFIWSLTPRTAA